MGPFFPTMEADRLTRRLRLLVVCPAGVLGGAESWLLTMLDAAADRIDVRAILLADGPLRHEMLTRGIPVTLRPTGASKADIAAASLWLRHQLNRHDPDLVLANGVKAAVVTAPAARWVGVRSVWVKHDHSFDTIAPLLGHAVTQVVATAASVGAPTKRDDLVVIEPPRPAEPLPRAAARSTLTDAGITIPPQATVLGMVGRYVPYKGIDVAIGALTELGTDRWHLAVLGGDEPNHPHERERLEKLAADLGVADRVHLGGFVAGAGRLVSAFDALAMLTHDGTGTGPGREGYGMAAAEAMAAGIPVIAAVPVDGGPSAIAGRIGADATGAVAGLLVPLDDPVAVGEALSTLTGNGLRQAMGEEGRRRIMRQPDAKSSAAQLAAVLAETALRPGAGARSGPPITVIAPVFNEGPVITTLLELVQPQLGPDDEFLLIDGGSTDGTRAVIEGFATADPRIRLVRDDGGNIAHSRNVGIRQAQHRVLACTDAGCDPGPNWLNAFRAAFADTATTDVGMVLGVYHTGMRRTFERAMAAVAWADPVELRRPTLFRRLYGKLLGRWFMPHRVEGRTVGFTREAFDAAGGFPEYLPTAEDVAFGKNLIAAGYRSIHSLDADVVWYQRPSIAATYRQFRGYGDGGGRSRSALLVLRDGVRVAGYGVAIALPLLLGTLGAAISVAGIAIYLSLPVARVIRRRQNPLLIALLPACYLLKDIAKVVGTTKALFRRRSL